MPAEDDPIIEIATSSPVRSYRWKDRGRAPAGYITGMALAFADAYRGLLAGDAIIATTAAPRANDPERDVLDWYVGILTAVGAGGQGAADRLIQIFAIMLGLGMRESSGKHCEGRDMSASNVSGETAEAGLFQVSHNSIDAHPHLRILFEKFRGHDDLLTIFDEGVRCSASSWANWGDRPGCEFQALMKRCPKFAVLYTGVLLRHARKHWGPIKRKEVEVTIDAVELFRAIKAAVDEE